MLKPIHSAIILYLFDHINSSQEDIEATKNYHWITSRSFRRHIPYLIKEWIVVCNNVWRTLDNGKTTYSKRYNLSYQYINSMTDKSKQIQQVNWSPDESNFMTITVKATDVVTINQNDRTMTFDPKKWYWEENGKRVMPFSIRQQYQSKMYWISKWEQVRINGIKDKDLKSELVDKWKELKQIQESRVLYKVDEKNKNVIQSVWWQWWLSLHSIKDIVDDYSIDK